MDALDGIAENQEVRVQIPCDWIGLDYALFLFETPQHCTQTVHSCMNHDYPVLYSKDIFDNAVINTAGHCNRQLPINS